MLSVVKNKNDIKRRGFTIVELLIVIVVIAILATIGMVVYSGVTKRARQASAESEASQLDTELALYNAENGDYPTEDEFNPDDDPTCSKDDSFCFDGQYPVDYECDDYGACSYEIWTDDTTDGSNDSECESDDCGAGVGGQVGGEIISINEPSDCPSGYIPVPGSARYGQDGFCVMKYEAKKVGGKAVSQASLTPWSDLTQEQAIAYSNSACSGCHLISESEWMTLAENILSVDENWTGGEVGNGKVYNGLDQNWYGVFAVDGDGAASNDDEDGYYGLPSGRDDQERRTYYLTNGEVIWDLSGNYSEFTSGQVSNNKPGCSSGMCDWGAVTTRGGMVPNIFPGSIGNDSVTDQNASSLGLGGLLSKSDNITNSAVIRGVAALHGFGRGLLEVDLMYAPSVMPDAGNIEARSGSMTTFRVCK